MYIDRLPDGTIIVELRWQDFAAEWKGAPDGRKAKLMDGRPAILQIADGAEPSYRTIPAGIWSIVRNRAQEAFAQAPPRKRERRCQNCDSPLVVAREYPHAWTFKCEKCGGREIWGKNLVGGTAGAGEEEKT